MVFVKSYQTTTKRAGALASSERLEDAIAKFRLCHKDLPSTMPTFTTCSKEAPKEICDFLKSKVTFYAPP